MALSGLQIYKLLPKTNCKECGFPTCLAFAMKLAAQQVDLDACPYVSAEAKEALSAAAAPPIRLVKLGTDSRKLEQQWRERGNEITTPDPTAFRKVAEQVLAQFEDRWGKGLLERARDVS